MKVTENPEQGARLERLMESLNITQTSLAQTIGISQGYVSQLAAGKRNISRRVLHFITNNYPLVNVRWLLTGEGEMFLDPGAVKNELKILPVDSQVMEERGSYTAVGGEGRLEWLERRVVELLERMEQVEKKLE